MTLARLFRQREEKEKAMPMTHGDSKTRNLQSFWQVVFSQSKVNGAPYFGDNLPRQQFNWPKDTYLQRRLKRSKWFQSTGNHKAN